MYATPLMEYMRESEKKVLDTTDLTNFYLHVCAFYSKLFSRALKQLPFDDVAVKDIMRLMQVYRLNRQFSYGYYGLLLQITPKKRVAWPLYLEMW